jgi:hypothetical protein
MKHLRKLSHIFQQIRDPFPLTLAGGLLAGGAYWVFDAYGHKKADMVLYAAGAVGMGFVGASLLFVLLGAALTLWLAPKPQDVGEATLMNTGEQLCSGYSAPNMRFWPMVEVSASWVEPRDVDVFWVPKGGRLQEWISPRSRGHIREVRRRFVVRDIFGLASLAFTTRRRVQIKVAPSAAQVDLSVALRDVSGDGYSHPIGQPEGELIEMRRYSPGDPLRLVLWKSFARTRRLLVRVPERAVTPQRSTIAVMVAGPEDEATASVARAFMEQGLLGSDFQFFADGHTQPARDLGACVDRLIDSALARDTGGDVLERLLTQVDPSQLGHCIVFAPSGQGPWLQKLHAFAQQLPSPPSVVIGVDGELKPATPKTWRRWLRRDLPKRDDKALRALPALYDQLSQAGGPVRMLHRGDGQLIDDASLDGLRSMS